MNMREVLTFSMLFISISIAKPEYRYMPFVQQEPEISEWDRFVQALILVESEGNPNAKGKTNDLGILQITPIYVADVNRIIKEERYTLDDRTDVQKSMEMFEIIQNHYNPEKEIDKAIRRHNPRAGKGYRDKIYRNYPL